VEPLRFFLDEDVDPLAARLLRDRGLDAVCPSEIGRRGVTDEEHLRFATAEGRVLVTFNVRDFVILARRFAAEGREHAGIVVSSQLPAPEVCRRLLRLRLARRSAEEMLNQFFWLNQFR
jgi:predicted nuclease of predicted toxin-antitoxin system